MKKLLMGNEAIALGAIRAGVSVVTGYPGTPSTEILETIARERIAERAPSIYVEWSVNEKSALEVAAGAACSGARALVTMKQVGLNVASDPLMSLNYLGVAAGMVIAVADDPGPISSQTEQDTRRFGLYAKLAVFDPSTPEEAYLMIADAFACSEKYGRPVIFRPTTRVCHSYASVEILPDLPRRPAGAFDRGGGRWVIFPSLANRNHVKIEADLVQMGDDFSASTGNRLDRERFAKGAVKSSPIPDAGSSPVLGIAAGGVSYAYVQEALAALAAAYPQSTSADYKLLKVGTFPFPEKPALQFLEGLREALVLEELDPVIEDELVRLCGRRHINVNIRGKRTGDTPNAGENTVAMITEKLRDFLQAGAAGHHDAAKLRSDAPAPVPPPLPLRPPVLCAGCPHRGSFFAVKEAVRKKGGSRKAVYSGDIGCYTLGNAPPLDMVDTCLCMGAGITMAQGINRAEPDTLNFAFIGDSTFFHTGIPGIINAVYNQADIIVVILDNYTTAMTGNQPHPGIGKTVQNAVTEKISIPAVVESLGIKEILRANPFDLKAAEEAVEKLLDKKGVRVIIFEGPCIAVHTGDTQCGIDKEKCTGCQVCVKKLGCPAISPVPGEIAPRSGGLRARIDPVLCTGCGICRDLCAAGAIAELPSKKGALS